MANNAVGEKNNPAMIAGNAGTFKNIANGINAVNKMDLSQYCNKITYTTRLINKTAIANIGDRKYILPAETANNKNTNTPSGNTAPIKDSSNTKKTPDIRPE